MNPSLALCFTLASLFYGGHAATITFTNKCPYTVWPGTITSEQKPQLSTTGFELVNRASNSLEVPSPWTGRFWARTGCSTSSGKFACTTADCGTGEVGCNGGAIAILPATLIELTVASNSGQDFYDVSIVDGFNVPMSIAPQGGTGDCQPASCRANINGACPEELQQKDSEGNVMACKSACLMKGSNGNVIACKSACLAFNQPQYCCTGDYNTAEKCPPTQYSEVFETQCPQAYSYAYDDKSSTFTCFSRPNYAITFCP
ncbi:thaumatin-like protein 1b [Senna tora]|uniref:Thaumatin-like protein 1b n=1 Tax=Senna tora TaxID=362788 RepID=A0A834WDL9_9FABA|nr:thaumatin-like protein 1b [Senna tora]